MHQVRDFSKGLVWWSLKSLSMYRLRNNSIETVIEAHIWEPGGRGQNQPPPSQGGRNLVSINEIGLTKSHALSESFKESEKEGNCKKDSSKILDNKEIKRKGREVGEEGSYLNLKFIHFPQNFFLSFYSFWENVLSWFFSCVISWVICLIN